jgi:cysteinyl-tRNA synthetase
MRHYRTQLGFNEADIAQAEEVLDKLRSVYDQFRAILETPSNHGEQSVDREIEQLATKATASFVAAMDDDFNTPRALATIITYAKDVETYANRKLNKQSLETIVRTFDYFGEVFGILRRVNAQQGKTFEDLINMVLSIRDEARKREDWKTSDNIRDQLRKIGIGLEDTPNGIRWYLASSKP